MVSRYQIVKTKLQEVLEENEKLLEENMKLTQQLKVYQDKEEALKEKKRKYNQNYYKSKK